MIIGRNMEYNTKKIQDSIFFLIVFCVIFDNIPKAFSFNFWGLGGPYSLMLGDYPIMIGFLFTAYLVYKKSINFWNRNVVSFFIVVVILSGASAIHGLYIYPYWDLLINAPEPQIEKLPGVLLFLQEHNFRISYEQLFSIWILVRSIKSVILDLIYRFGLSYMIYLWYKNDFRRAWNVLWKGMVAGVIIFITYGFVDVCFLHGSSVATSILKRVNPLLHDIGKIHEWWPPLLWKGQFRSVFSEPSRVGNYIAFILPLLFEPIFNKTKYWKRFLIVIYIICYMVFLTHARTAVSMLLGIMGLTTLVLVVFRWTECLKQFSTILLVTVLAFCTSIGSIMFVEKENGIMDEPNEVAVRYVEDNVNSLASSNKRSNRARYALLKANIKIGLEYPVLGVGPMLNGAYVVNHFDEYDLESDEVQQWIKAYWEMGPLKHNFDAMNEYVTVFSTNGFLGLICLFTPFIFGCFKLWKYIDKCIENNRKRKSLCLFISVISSLVAGCNGSLIIIYAIWILLAMVYIILSEQKELTHEKPF